MPHDHHGHDDGHHHHHDVASTSDGRLIMAVAINVGLTVVEVVAGVLAGSLALIADAVHNFTDAASLGVALAARRIGRRVADEQFTYGYRRAELVGALINLTTLLVIAFFLVLESIERMLDPQPVMGIWVVAAASVALVVDLGTAGLLWRMSEDNMNVRAAWLHNLTDAAASLAVIATGAAIAVYDIALLDPLVTVALAAWMAWMAIGMLKRTATMLMDGTPPGLDLQAVADAIAELPGVVHAHHLHAREIDEDRRSLEAHIIVERDVDAEAMIGVTRAARELLQDRFDVQHTTLQLELATDTGSHRPLIAEAAGIMD